MDGVSKWVNDTSVFGWPIEGTGKQTNYNWLRSLPAKLLKTSCHVWPQNSSSNATSGHELKCALWHKDNIMLSICHVIAVKVLCRADSFHQCHDPQVGLQYMRQKRLYCSYHWCAQPLILINSTHDGLCATVLTSVTVTRLTMEGDNASYQLAAFKLNCSQVLLLDWTMTTA